MMRLLRVELRRLYARRLVVLAMAFAVAFSVLMLVGVWQTTRPASDAEIAEAQHYYEEQLAHWEQYGEEEVADCREAEAEDAERSGEPVDYGCDSYGPPELEWFLHTPSPLHETFDFQVAGFGILPLVIALIVGVTFTAAELSTGAVTTWLSFEPRRLRVYLSKVIAAAAGFLPVALVMVAVVVLGTWAINAQAGLADGLTTGVWTDVGQTSLRILALAGLGALVGAALGVVLRHTAAVLGAGVVYVVVEQIVTAFFPRTQPWVLTQNILGWVQGGTSYYVETCTTDGAGVMCDYVEHTLSFGHSATYLLVLAALAVTLGGLVFRRRDFG